MDKSLRADRFLVLTPMVSKTYWSNMSLYVPSVGPLRFHGLGNSDKVKQIPKLSAKQRDADVVSRQNHAHDSQFAKVSKLESLEEGFRALGARTHYRDPGNTRNHWQRGFACLLELHGWLGTASCGNVQRNQLRHHVSMEGHL